MAKRIVHNDSEHRYYVRPTRTQWESFVGIYFDFAKANAEELVAAGILLESEVPGDRYKCAFNGDTVKVHRCRDGSVNARVYADVLLSRDRPFKRFLGGLLADARLSLVRRELP